MYIEGEREHAAEHRRVLERVRLWEDGADVDAPRVALHQHEDQQVDHGESACVQII